MQKAGRQQIARNDKYSEHSEDTIRWTVLCSEWIFDHFLIFLCLQVERGSPKSCFLFLGEVLCEVNWVSVLSDHLQTPPTLTTYPTLQDTDTQKESHTMLVYLLYMLVFLAKEEQILSTQVNPVNSSPHHSRPTCPFYVDL